MGKLCDRGAAGSGAPDDGDGELAQRVSGLSAKGLGVALREHCEHWRGRMPKIVRAPNFKVVTYHTNRPQRLKTASARRRAEMSGM
jgi:hypothetical protein